ncbi:adenylate/guanylate cyclase domain-containing protein [uncultured Desulfobacter sp.]|uniref:CHASE2 domain-containing protein n=1 Tax=uncultured Desulfobacter sp. TaxID=240139 RepID=UPI002AA8A53F|nr:adenylate/guanylate cyclase domain-containing protein [uncultured Desulfobacter sp.]
MLKDLSFSWPAFFLGCGLTAATCTILYLCGGEKPSLIAAVDNRTMDIMFRIRGVSNDSGQVVIVDIDEKSLSILGQWPWSRNIMAKITDHLIQSGVRAIGYDILFAEQDRSSPAYFFSHLDKKTALEIPENLVQTLGADPALDYDQMFATSLSRGPTILGYGFQFVDDGLKSNDAQPFPSGVIRLDPATLQFDRISLIPAFRAVLNHSSVSASQSEGFINVLTDDSGLARQVPLVMVMNNIPYSSLALEVFRVGMNIPDMTIHASSRIKANLQPVLGLSLGDRFIPTDSIGQIFVNYRGPSGTFDYISAVDVLEKKRVPELKDKFVFIGASATGLLDLKATPFGSAVPGVEINATIVDNLIQSDAFTYDRMTEIGLNYTLIVLNGLALTLVLCFLGPVAGGVATAGFLICMMLGNYFYFFLNHQYVGISLPLISSIFILLVMSIFKAFREGKSRRFIQSAFSRYVAPDVVDHLIKTPKALSLTGQEKILTVMFCDIRGFTTLSEKMTPQQLGRFMNQFLTAMSEKIMENSGTVDKFIGDAVMAFWGAPKSDPEHAEHAVHTALQFKGVLENLARTWEKKGLSGVSVGVGINTGPVSVGNFGSLQRFDYTVMGDNVNLASRLEGANKNYGTSILISKATRDLIQEKFFCRFVDKVQVKGRQQPEDLYEPLCQGLPSQDIIDEIRVFEQGVEAFQQADFKQAKKIFSQLDQTNPCRLYLSYLDRINGYLESSVPPGWDGAERRERLPVVNRLTTK